MAYYNSKETQKIVARLEKNKRGDFIQVSRIIPDDKKKLESVDIRLLYTDDEGEVKPTQKGVRVNSETVVDLVKAILKALSGEEFEEVKEYVLNKEDEGEESEEDDFAV